MSINSNGTDLLPGNFLLFTAIGAGKWKPLAHVEMSYLLVHGYRVLAELACHVSLGAVVAQVLV